MPASAPRSMPRTRDEEDPLLRALLGALHHRPTALAASAERAVLSALGAGCAAPVGAYARVDEASSALLLDARVMSVDGRERVEASGALALLAICAVRRQPLPRDRAVRGHLLVVTMLL